MRHKPRLDSNQAEIVAALRAAGASVQSTASLGRGVPDVVVGFRGRNFWLEIKDGSKKPSEQKLTEDEREWQGKWMGHVAVVTCIEDALRAIGLNGRPTREQKINWLAVRPELWADLPDDEIEMLWSRNHKRYRQIAREMRTAGLFAGTTGLIDMRLGQLILAAKQSVGSA